MKDTKTVKKIVSIVEGLALNGRAFINADGCELWLNGFLPGDKIEVGLNEKGYIVEAELLEASPNRVKPDCFYHGPCGGCDLLELSEKARKKEKQKMIDRALSGITDGHKAKVHPFMGSREIIHYMPRVRLHQSRSYEERASGFLASEAFAGKVPGGVVPVTSCALLMPTLSRRLVAARKILDQVPIFLESLNLMSSSSLQADRVVGHAVLMKGKSTGPFYKDLVKIMRSANLKGLTVASADGKIKEVLEIPTVTGLIAPDVDGGPYESEASFFVQGNICQNPLLVRKVVEFCSPEEGKRIVEGFAGAGNFTLALGAAGAKVEAVESHPGAVRAGIKNIHKGGLSGRVSLVEGDAIKMLPEFEPNPDVLLLDPPRTGTPGIGRILSKLAPKKVVCVFCDLESAVKDTNAMIRAGYRFTDVQGIDLYPRTHHVEMVVLMSRVEKQV